MLFPWIRLGLGKTRRSTTTRMNLEYILGSSFFRATIMQYWDFIRVLMLYSQSNPRTQRRLIALHEYGWLYCSIRVLHQVVPNDFNIVRGQTTMFCDIASNTAEFGFHHLKCEKHSSFTKWYLAPVNISLDQIYLAFIASWATRRQSVSLVPYGPISCTRATIFGSSGSKAFPLRLYSSDTVSFRTPAKLNRIANIIPVRSLPIEQWIKYTSSG